MEEEEEDEISSYPNIKSYIRKQSLGTIFCRRKNVTSREKLNKFLISRYLSPIRHSLETPWAEASERTKRLYTRKVGQVVNACFA